MPRRSISDHSRQFPFAQESKTMTLIIEHNANHPNKIVRRVQARFSIRTVWRGEFEASRSFARLAFRARAGRESRSLGRDAFCSGNRSSRTIIISDLWMRDTAFVADIAELSKAIHEEGDA